MGALKPPPSRLLTVEDHHILAVEEYERALMLYNFGLASSVEVAVAHAKVTRCEAAMLTRDIQRGR